MDAEADRPLTDWEVVVLRPGRYEVPRERAAEFEAVMSRAHEIYERHALSWLVLRSRADPSIWLEFDHRFREQADLRAARSALEKPPSIIEALNEFEQGWENDSGGIVEAHDGSEWKTVFAVGERGAGRSERPAIPPEEMTDTMRGAQELAAALAPRLAAVAPEGFTVAADQEVILIGKAGGLWGEVSLVDLSRRDGTIAALGELAEMATEELTVPWPHDPAQGYADHEPDMEIRDGYLHAWFGDKANPVLSLEPFPLAS